MRPHRSGAAVPLWMNDARLRRSIADSVRRRRAKRMAELAKFERAVRMGEQLNGKPA
jgi:hypothetical protein